MRSIPEGHRGRASLLAALPLTSAPWLARAEPPAPPTILFADIESGPTTGGPNNRGVPIAVFGSGFGSAHGTSSVTIGGIEVASYRVWGTHNALNPTLDMRVVQPGPNVTGGAIRVIVGGQASRGNLSFTPNTGHLRYVSVAGFRFQSGKSIGVPDAGDTNRRRGDRLINNAVVGPVAWSFIDTHGDDQLIAGNVCAATSSVIGTQGQRFYISYGNGVKVIYNIDSGAPGYGIHESGGCYAHQRSCDSQRPRELLRALPLRARDQGW